MFGKAIFTHQRTTMPLDVLLQYTELAVAAVGAWFSFRTFDTRSTPSLRYIWFYSLFSLVAAAVVYLNPDDSLSAHLGAQVLFVFETVFGYYFFYHLVHSKLVRQICFGLFVGLLLWWVQQMSRHGVQYGVSPLLYLTQSVIFLILCFTYFKEIFIYQRATDLLKDATFWIVISFMLAYASLIPIILWSGYLYFINQPDLARSEFMFNTIFNIITEGLFIKGMLCLPKRRRSLS